MRRYDIIKKLKKYFEIEELVGSRTAARHGERAWRFLDTDALQALLIVRTKLGKPITVNYNDKEQRGLRSNIQPLVKKKTKRNKLYLSAHLFGKAFDFDVEGMKASEVRRWILLNSSKFPFKVRLEKGVSWVHMDTVDEPHNPHIYAFNP